MSIEKNDYLELLNELIALVEKTKSQVISYTNSSLAVLFWQIGRVSTHILKNKWAAYGKQIVVTVSRDLVTKFSRNYEEKNLRRMMQFAEQYLDVEKVVTLSRHFT